MRPSCTLSNIFIGKCELIIFIGRSLLHLAAAGLLLRPQRYDRRPGETNHSTSSLINAFKRTTVKILLRELAESGSCLYCRDSTSPLITAFKLTTVTIILRREVLLQRQLKHVLCCRSNCCCALLLPELRATLPATGTTPLAAIAGWTHLSQAICQALLRANGTTQLVVNLEHC